MTPEHQGLSKCLSFDKMRVYVLFQNRNLLDVADFLLFIRDSDPGEVNSFSGCFFIVQQHTYTEPPETA